MNSDYFDLLAAFNAQSVEYLVVGAHALVAHGHVRATRDPDVWVRPDAANAGRVLTALRQSGAPLQDLSEQDLTEPGLIFRIGVESLRIDVITAIDGIEFDEAWRAPLDGGIRRTTGAGPFKTPPAKVQARSGAIAGLGGHRMAGTVGLSWIRLRPSVQTALFSVLSIHRPVRRKCHRAQFAESKFE